MISLRRLFAVALLAIAASPANAEGSVPLAGRRLGAGAVEARFRPEAARISEAGGLAGEGDFAFHGEVVAVSYPGGHWRHTILVGGTEILADAGRAFAPGTRVAVHVAPDALFLFDQPDIRPQVAQVSRRRSMIAAGNVLV